MSTTLEQKAKESVKRAYTLTTESLKETGASGNRLEQLIIALTPKVFEAITNHVYTEKPQAPPITSVTPIPTDQKPTFPSPPLQMQVFEEFLKRLPAELRPRLRVKDHTGTEILVVADGQLPETTFAAVCRAAEESKGKWVSAGKDSAWHLPLKIKER